MAKIPLVRAGIGFPKEPAYGVKEAGEVPDQPYVFSFADISKPLMVYTIERKDCI